MAGNVETRSTCFPIQQDVKDCPGPVLQLGKKENDRSKHREALIATLVMCILGAVLFLGAALGVMTAPLWAPLMLGLMAGGILIGAIVIGVLIAKSDAKGKEEKEANDPELRCKDCKSNTRLYPRNTFRVSSPEDSLKVLRIRLTHSKMTEESIQKLLEIYTQVKNGTPYNNINLNFLEYGDLKKVVQSELTILAELYIRNFQPDGRVPFASGV